jgi:hypothetical protein
VAFDFGINSGAPDSPKVAAGTAQLAETIDYARSRGTAVIIGVRKKELDGSIDTEPSVFQALQLTKPGYALGYAANPCTGISNGASVFTTPLVIHPGRPHHASIALASVAALWRTPGIAIDRADRMVFLSGEGGQHDVAYARLARPLTGNPGCGALIAGDQPAQQLIDVSAGDVARGAAQVTPFEDAVSGAGLPDLKGKLVFVGGQLPRDDLHRVLQCGATPWSCAYVDRWGFGLHLDAVNSVLHERAIRPIQPFSQLLLILALCLTVAWQRLQNRGRALWVRRASLLGLVLVDMVLVAGAAVFLEVLMDQAYHLLAMLSVYALVGRLDRR